MIIKNILKIGIMMAIIAQVSFANPHHTIVKFEISQNNAVPYGDIIIELYDDKAPITVDNFLTYVENGYYNGTIFHRVIKDFIIQGGGFVPGLDQKKANPPIKNEANNGLLNERGTVAMARTLAIDSATAQFFFNLVDNTFLNHSGNTTRTYGYAVFGKIISGMSLIDEIAQEKTTRFGRYRDVPINNYIITQSSVLSYGKKWKEKKEEQKTPTSPLENSNQ